MDIFSFEILENPIIVFKTDGKVVFANSAFNDTFADYKDKSNILVLKNIVHIDFLWKFEAMFTNLASTKQARGEFVFNSKDGRKITFEVILKMLAVPEGNIIICQLFSLDAVKKIENVNSQLEVIFQKINEIVIVFDVLTGYVISANPAAARAYGYTHQEIMVKKLNDFNVSFEASYHKIDNSLVEDGKGILFETKQKRKDNTIFYAEINAIVTKLQDRHSLICIIRDITNRKKEQEILENQKEELETLVQQRTKELELTNLKLKEKLIKLTTTEEKTKNQSLLLRTLLDTIPVPVVVKDEKKTIWYCNKSYLEFSGTAREEVIGKTIYDIEKDIDIAKQIDLNDDIILHSNDLKSTESKIVTSKGETKYILSFYASFKKADNTPAGIIHVFTDITERKQNEERMNNLLKIEQENLNIKSCFISIVSHEFLTPLTAINSSAEFLKLYLKDDPRNKIFEHLNRIMTSVKNITLILEDVVYINRADTDKFDFNADHFLPEDLIADIFAEQSVFYKFKGDFSYDIDKSIKSGVVTDPKLFRIMIGNLLSNALKFNPQGKVSISWYIENNYHTITVEDDGCGIAEEDQKNIFNQFFRGRNSIGVFGTGLGLSIIKRIVQNFNGSINFVSEEGKGTKFYLIFPLSIIR